jgi:Chaperone of endosialidase
LASRELEGSSRLQQGKFKRNEQKQMKTLIRSINRSPLRCGFFTLAIALCWLTLSPPLKAADCPTECGSGGNAAFGINALDSVTTGINNVAVGTGALTDDTGGSFNVAVGNAALLSNTTGFQNMAIGAEALANNLVGNFNMAIGFRALFMNTGNRNSAIGAAALRNNEGASDNTAIGSQAMRENTTGEQNTAIGAGALQANTTVGGNTAVGFQALTASETSFGNVALGESALASFTGAGTTTTNGFNTALGSLSLNAATAGQENTAVGRRSLEFLLTGSNNTIIGWRAGDNYTSDESGNILIGSGVSGSTGEDNTIRIGSNLSSSGINISAGPPSLIQAFTIGSGFQGGGIQYLQFFGNVISIAPNFSTANGASNAFMGGIFNQTPVAGSHFVGVGPNNQLSDLNVSSRRFKKDIAAMDKASEGILALKPVTFHWKNDNTNEPEFGLVAEEVAEVNLDWITRDDKGEISGVRYETIPVLLLNEFLKEHKKVEEQQASIADLKSTVALQQKDMQVLTAQLKEQAAQIQKVSAQLEASKPAPKVVTNK